MMTSLCNANLNSNISGNNAGIYNQRGAYLPGRRYSTIMDGIPRDYGVNMGRRNSLPVAMGRFTPLVRVERKISRFETPRCDGRNTKMRFDSTIRRDHIRRLVILISFVVFVSLVAISYSFYKVVRRN